MNKIIRLYALLVCLYPRNFRDEFGDEMRTVFADTIADAASHGRFALIALCARELWELPGNLWREYRAALGKEVRMSQVIDATDAIFDQERKAGSRRDAVFAALPHLLYFGLMSLPNILFSFNLISLPVNQVLGVIPGLIFLIITAISIPACWRAQNERWVGSWYGYWFLGGALAVIFVIQNMLPRFETIVIQFLPQLCMLIFLFIIIQRDRIRGLLTVIPWFIVFWLPLLEFIPNGIRTPLQTIWGLSFAILAAIIVRRDSVRIAVWSMIAFNGLWGLVISYAQTYLIVLPPEAGTEWQTRSAVDWVNYFVPTLLTTSTVIIGPLLAWALQELGRRFGAWGITAFRIALAGLALSLFSNLGMLWLTLDRISFYINIATQGLDARTVTTFLSITAYTGLLIYLIGALALVWMVTRGKSSPRFVSLGTLVVILLAVPMLFMLQNLYGLRQVPEYFLFGFVRLYDYRFLMYGIGLIWLFASGALVTHWSARQPTPRT